ncbi:hypothetical protein GDO81_029782 [Engystomops pustulosus]|uniref:Uncharacterized protein n=1 Tax=Engystomops pustulosus TaxID=76066 RepID=A0AAV6ZF09_ENGPU|nr:hypothetical protein GDO81_029782 [Engystomops pustulosus]
MSRIAGDCSNRTVHPTRPSPPDSQDTIVSSDPKRNKFSKNLDRKIAPYLVYTADMHIYVSPSASSTLRRLSSRRGRERKQRKTGAAGSDYYYL